MLVVNSSQTVVEVKPSAGEPTIANMEIKVLYTLGGCVWFEQFVTNFFL